MTKCIEIMRTHKIWTFTAQGFFTFAPFCPSILEPLKKFKEFQVKHFFLTLTKLEHVLHSDQVALPILHVWKHLDIEFFQMNVPIDEVDKSKKSFDFVELFSVDHLNSVVPLMNRVLHRWSTILDCYFLMTNLEEVKPMKVREVRQLKLDEEQISIQICR